MIVTAVPGSDSQRAQALALKLDPEYPVPGAELDRRFGGPKIGFDTTYRQVRVTLAFDFASHTLARHSRSERIEQCTNFASAALTMDERANQRVPDDRNDRRGSNDADQDVATPPSAVSHHVVKQSVQYLEEDLKLSDLKPVS
jgi:hypothetical protein